MISARCATFGVAVMALAVSALPSAAADWTAVSTTAMAVTGDVAIDEEGIVFANGASLVFADLADAPDFEVAGEKTPAFIYRIQNPADPELENGNRLCGAGDVSYLVVWRSDLAGSDGRTLAVFTGEDAPSDDADMCASYTYEVAP